MSATDWGYVAAGAATTLLVVAGLQLLAPREPRRPRWVQTVDERWLAVEGPDALTEADLDS